MGFFLAGRFGFEKEVSPVQIFLLEGAGVSGSPVGRFFYRDWTPLPPFYHTFNKCAENRRFASDGSESLYLARYRAVRT